jgi:hypothetical protein
VSAAGFTPGPWAVMPEESDRLYIRVRGKRLGERYKIANVLFPAPYKGEKEDALANAHLIAAAPELHEALLLWLAYDDQDEADFAEAGPMLLYARAIDATRKALAKARGDQ